MEKDERKCFNYFGTGDEKTMEAHHCCWVRLIWLFLQENFLRNISFSDNSSGIEKFVRLELKVMMPLITYQPHNTYFKERWKVPDILILVDMYLLLPRSKSLAARKQSKQTPKPHLSHVQCVLNIVVAHMSHISRTSSTGRFHAIWP